MLRAVLATLIAAAAFPAVAVPVAITLPDAVARALVANRSLAASRLARDGEQHSLEIARSDFELKLVPTSSVGRLANNSLSPQGGLLNATLGVSARRKLEWGTVVSIGPSYNRAGDASNTSVNASVQQPLLAGFGSEVNLEPVRQAEFALASADRSLEQAGINTALDTIATYHEALRQQHIAELSDALDRRLARHALISSRKERAGLASPMDTFRAEIRRRDAQEFANQARTAYEAAIGRLRVLIVLPWDTEPKLTPPPPVAIDPGPLEELALARRIELRQMQAEAEEARRAVGVAHRATLPDVSLNVSYGHSALGDPLLGSLVPATQRQWSLYLSVSGDIRRTAEREAHRRAAVRLMALQAALAEKSDDIRRQIRQQVRAIDESRTRMALREEQIRQAEGKLALAEVKFAHDMADNFDLIEAETELYRARIDLAAALGEHAVGIHGLRAATGGLYP